MQGYLRLQCAVIVTYDVLSSHYFPAYDINTTTLNLEVKKNLLTYIKMKLEIR